MVRGRCCFQIIFGTLFWIKYSGWHFCFSLEDKCFSFENKPLISTSLSITVLTPFASGCHLGGRILWHLRCCWWKRDLLYCVSQEGKLGLWLRWSDWNCNVGNISEPPSDLGHVDPDADLSLWLHCLVVCVFCLWCWGWNLGPYSIS